MLGFLLAGVIIDVGERVELVCYDIDIVATDTMALHGDALALIGACDGVELTTAHLALLGVEMGGNGIYTGGIAHEYHFICQLFWLEMQMET